MTLRAVCGSEVASAILDRARDESQDGDTKKTAPGAVVLPQRFEKENLSLGEAKFPRNPLYGNVNRHETYSKPLDQSFRLTIEAAPRPPARRPAASVRREWHSEIQCDHLLLH